MAVEVFFEATNPWYAHYFSLIVEVAMVALLASYCRLGVAFVPIAIVVMLLTFSIQLGVSNEVNRGGVFKLFAMLIFLLSATGYRNYFKVPLILVDFLFLPILLALPQAMEHLTLRNKLRSKNMCLWR